MASQQESMKLILAEVEKFLNETLKKETKLSKKTLEHKQLVLDKLSKFYEEHPHLVPIQSSESLQVTDVEGSGGSSSMTGGSTKSEDQDESAYIDAGIALTPATDLKDPLFAAMLDKKQKKGSGLLGPKFQSRWCVITEGIFYYYEKPKDKKQCGSFKLDGYRFRSAPDVTNKKKEKELAFEIFSLDESKRIYQFVAKSKADYEQCQLFVESGGLPLIEEDLYEEVGEQLRAKAADVPLIQEAEYVEDIQVKVNAADDDGELYEETEAVDDKPPPPPPSPRREPPPAPIETIPQVRKLSVASTKQEEPLPPPPPIVEEELYDDAVSKEETLPPPPLPEVPETPPPPPPSRARPRPNRELPKVPGQPAPKKRINVTITCKPEEDFENRFFGKWDCAGSKDNELTFKQGDIIYIVSREFDAKSWWVGELNGKFGLVPKNYLVPAFEPVEL